MHNLHPGANLLPGAKLHPGINLHSPYVAFICQYIVFICFWICSLNISQMFQFYIKEKFDVLRMFRLWGYNIGTLTLLGFSVV